MRVCSFGRSARAAGITLCLASAPAFAQSLPLPVTLNDVRERGTQPNTILTEVFPADSCILCHLGDATAAATTLAPWRWRGSMHSHAWKDPIFQAALTIANQDTVAAAQTCIRCHAAPAFLEGRSVPTDGSMLSYTDQEFGVTCEICHRLVNPVYPRASYVPAADQMILADLAAQNLIPVNPGNAQMVMDPSDVRRGPYTVSAPHPWAFSPFHLTGDICGTCHDVSNPAFDRIGTVVPDPSDVYRLNASDTPHPTDNKYDMVPEQRTYSEWLNSKYAQMGVPRNDPADPYNLNGRFGGNRTTIAKCQDCHMPTVSGRGCVLGGPVRNDLAQHNFAAANTLALDLLLHLYTPDNPSDPQPGEFVNEYDGAITLINRQKADNIAMLGAATDLYLTQQSCELNARVVNQCGHKLLTGYPEGRRIWINVKFFNGLTQIAERGVYNFTTATLFGDDTKVYETKFGHDDYMAGQSGLPQGPSFHLTTVNKIFKDNRIPPRGFTNAAYKNIQALPVGASFADNQHWDDTKYLIPANATRATVTVYYQTASREYIEFLRDANTTNNKGQVLYDAWVATGKGPPVIMDQVSLNLTPFTQPGDADGDLSVGLSDIAIIVTNWLLSGMPGTQGDLDNDGVRGLSDIALVVNNWGAHCP
jgi:hypothetical protein